MDSLWHCFNHITIVFRWYKPHYYCLSLLYQQKSYRNTSYRYHYRHIPIVIRISYITTVVIYLYNWNHHNWQLAPNPSSPSRFPGFLSEGPASHWVRVMRVKMTNLTSPAMYSIYIYKLHHMHIRGDLILGCYPLIETTIELLVTYYQELSSGL